MKETNTEFNEDYKDILLNYDPIYFVKLVCQKNNYSEPQSQELLSSFEQTLKELNSKKKSKQFYLHLEGQVRLMVENQGFLPALFGLDGITRNIGILDFKAYGKDLAHFEVWRKKRKRRMTQKRAWKFLQDIGTVLAYIVAVIQIVTLVYGANK